MNLSVSVCTQLENRAAELHQIFVHVAYGRAGSVWWHSDTLCTSGFMDDVMFL